MEKESATNYWRRLDSLALTRCGLGRSSVDGYHSNKGRGQTRAVDPLSRASFIWSMRGSSISRGKSSRSPSSGPQGVLSALGRRRSALRRRTALESSRAYNGVAAATRACISSQRKNWHQPMECQWRMNAKQIAVSYRLEELQGEQLAVRRRFLCLGG